LLTSVDRSDEIPLPLPNGAEHFVGQASRFLIAYWVAAYHTSSQKNQA
jgi:hypothetical protein